MKLMLIIVTLLLMAAVGISWTPDPYTEAETPTDDSTIEPIYYDSVPVEYIVFEPAYITVGQSKFDSYDNYTHSEIN